MKLAQIMTEKVETVDLKTPIKEAASRMSDRDVGMLVVVDGGKLVGTLTDRDMCVNGIARGLDPDKTTVSEVFSHEVIGCGRNDDVENAAKRMQEKKIRRLVVMDGKTPCGVVSLGDLARSVEDAKLMRKTLEAVS